MELLLWRWSTAIQVTSVAMIVAFFATLARSTPRAELRWWLLAWIANLGALADTVFYWYFTPTGWLQPVVRFGYLWSKTAFLWLFIQGAWAIVRPGTRIVRVRHALAAITAFAAIGAFVLSDVNRIGAGQHLLMTVLLAFAAAMLARSRDWGLTWLAIGVAIQMMLALIEAGAYAIQLMPPSAVSAATREATGTFLSAHSFLDTGAMWLLALGAALAVSERAQRELRNNNQLLLAVQENLRRLVDRDPLTALANRRALPEVLRGVQPRGATLLFFDLDKFKEINDLHGHQIGDECLKRFAVALRESFRPDDAVVRYAGDEFLVVASGLSSESCNERLERLRDRLSPEETEGPSIQFSVGIAQLPAGGQPETALRAADEAMYRAKAATASASTVALSEAAVS